MVAKPFNTLFPDFSSSGWRCPSLKYAGIAGFSPIDSSYILENSDKLIHLFEFNLNDPRSHEPYLLAISGKVGELKNKIKNGDASFQEIYASNTESSRKAEGHANKFFQLFSQNNRKSTTRSLVKLKKMEKNNGSKPNLVLKSHSEFLRICNIYTGPSKFTVQSESHIPVVSTPNLGTYKFVNLADLNLSLRLKINDQYTNTADYHRYIEAVKFLKSQLGELATD